MADNIDLSKEVPNNGGLNPQQWDQFLKENPDMIGADPTKQISGAMAWHKQQLDKQSALGEGTDTTSQAFKYLGGQQQQSNQQNAQYQQQAMKALQMQNSGLSKYLGASTTGMMNQQIQSAQPQQSAQLALNAAQNHAQLASQQLLSRESQRQLQNHINTILTTESAKSQRDANQQWKDTIAQQQQLNVPASTRHANDRTTQLILGNQPLRYDGLPIGGSLGISPEDQATYKKALSDLDKGLISEDEYNRIRWQIKDRYNLGDA